MLELPLELRTRILDEVPQFTRLSKNNMAGKNHLNYLSQRNITKCEFTNYLKLNIPERIYIFEEYMDKYVIHDISNLDIKYYLKRYIIEQNGNRILLDDEELVDTFSVDEIIDLINKMSDNLVYDLFNSIKIYQQQRKECINYKSILTDKLVNFTNQYSSMSDISTVMNDIKIYLYVNCNYFNLINFSFLPITIDLLICAVKDLIFDTINEEQQVKLILLDRVLKLSYPKNLSDLLSYLDDLK